MNEQESSCFHGQGIVCSRYALFTLCIASSNFPFRGICASFHLLSTAREGLTAQQLPPLSLVIAMTTLAMGKATIV